MHIAYMAKDAAITIRIPGQLKDRLEGRAKRQRRSLSAQVAHDLEQLLARDGSPVSGRFLGRHEGATVPSDAEILTVRRRLWSRLTTGSDG